MNKAGILECGNAIMHECLNDKKSSKVKELLAAANNSFFYTEPGNFEFPPMPEASHAYRKSDLPDTRSRWDRITLFYWFFKVEYKPNLYKSNQKSLGLLPVKFLSITR